MTRTYGELVYTPSVGWVMRGVEPHVAIKLKSVFPHINRGSRGPFTFMPSPEKCADLAWFESRFPMAMADGDRALLAAGREAYEAAMAELGRIALPDYAPPPVVGLRPGQEARQHQVRAADILQRVGGLLVGDDVGEGKTYTTGVCCLLPGALPATIVVLPHLKGQWRSKLEEFTGLSCHCIQGTRPYDLPPADVRILGYTQLQGWSDVLPLLGSGLVAFDEMQELRRGEETEKGKAARGLVESARYRLGLTATPIYNYGGEIWEVMNFLRPELLEDRHVFYYEWCRPLGNGKYVVRDPKALGSYLREQSAFIRKEKDRAGKPNAVVQTVGHDPSVLDDIEALARSLAVQATTGTFEERGEASRMLDLRVRHATGVAKAPYVADAVRLLVEAGEPVILFGWHREVYEIWLKRLSDLRPVLFTGSESPRLKERAKAAFLNGETDLLIMSLRSGAGTDGLQARCRTVAFGEWDWSPGIHHQCIGRVDREGQPCYPEPVTAIYYAANDGSDPAMREVHGLKASQASSIVDPHLGVQRAAADISHLKGLVERYLSRGSVAA